MKNDALILKKVLEHCDGIMRCIALFGEDEEIFLSNEIFQKSCVFDIIQIGELVKDISSGFKEKHRHLNWRGMTGVRNIIVHNYGEIIHEDIWIMMTEDIPELRAVCEGALSGVK